MDERKDAASYKDVNMQQGQVTIMFIFINFHQCLSIFIELILHGHTDGRT